MYYDWVLHMRKRNLVPIAALAVGAIGAVLRRWELGTAFEENGLPIPWASATVTLALFTAMAIALCAVLAVLVGRSFVTPEGYKRVFRTDSYLLFAVMALLGLAVAVAAVLTALGTKDILGLTGALRWVFLALMALGGLGLTVMAYSAYTQKDTPLIKVGTLLPSVFFCLWMVALYRQNAGNPVLLDYCYSALALGAAAVSAYCAAGYAFGRRSLRGTVFMSLAAIYLLAVATADPAPLALKLALIAMAVFLTVNTTSLLSRLTPKDPPDPEEEEEYQE